MKNILAMIITITLMCSIIDSGNAQTPEWLWAKGPGGSVIQSANSVAIDNSGNLYVAGTFGSSTVIFGSDTLYNSGLMDVFLAKYDKDGNVIWAKSPIGTGGETANGVAVDVHGNIYITGHFSSPTLTFDSYILTNIGSYDVFVAKYDPNGNVLWAKGAAGTGKDFSLSIAVDNSGSSYITGYFSAPSISFGTTSLYSSGVNDFFLAKFNTDGNVVWAKNALCTSNDAGYSIALDASGDCYLTGFYFGSITFNNTQLINKGSHDIFLAKYDVNGNVIWAKGAGGASSDMPHSIALDASGNCYMTGSFMSPSLNFGSTSLTNEGNYDIFIAKYDVNGNPIWARSAGGASQDLANSISSDAHGNSYIAGYYSSPALDFDTINLTNTGNEDFFVVKYDANGNVLWAKSAKGNGDDIANSFAIDNFGNSYVVGEFGVPSLTLDSIILTNTGVSDILIAKLSASSLGNLKIKQPSKITVYPNLVSNFMTVEIEDAPYQAELFIMNLWGQEILSKQITMAKNRIDLSSLHSGIYIVNVKSDRSLQAGKFVKY